MRKGTDVMGTRVVAFNIGKRVAQIQDLIFDQDTNQLLGFLVKESSFFDDAKVIPLQSIKAIGSNAVVIADRRAIVSSKTVPQIDKILGSKLVLRGTQILTINGRSLGSIVDLYFDEKTGRIEGYEASGGLFADAYSGRSFIPALQAIKIGHDVTFVPPETAILMEEQVGGLKGAIDTASTKVQESAEVAGQKLQETAQSANEKLQQAATTLNSSLQQGSHKATTALTNTIVSPEEQYSYVIGKPTERDVTTSTGQVVVAKDQIVTQESAKLAYQLGVLDQLYRATGGNLTEPAGRRLQDAASQAGHRIQGAASDAKGTLNGAIARVSVEQAKGHRTQRMVREGNGFIIAAPGQIVTTTVIERAKAYHQEAALLDAVGLQPSEAAQYNAGDALTETKYRLREGAAIAQENASTVWHDLNTQFHRLKNRSARAIHARRIEQALGRPVSRVILDRQDRVILNMGELITHRAILQAEQSGVLNILLSSIYIKQPDISTAELRASERGMAALEIRR